MRVEQLQYVLEIEKCKSMSKASKNLYITQQNLSYAIKTLETELGITILDRRGQGCQLTSEGALFSDFCKNVLREWNDFEQRLAAYRTQKAANALEGELVLYINKMYETFILPDILGDFMIQYPNIKIKTIPADVSEGENIRRDENFVWLLNLPRTAKTILPYPTINNDDFEFHTLFNSKSVLCVNRDNPLARNSVVSLKTALQFPLIYHGMSVTTEDKSKTSLFRVLVGHYGDYEINVAAQTESYGIWLDMIASGKGVGIISDKIIDKLKIMYPRQWENLAVVMIKEYLGYATGYAVRNTGMTEIESVFVSYLVENCNW